MTSTAGLPIDPSAPDCNLLAMRPYALPSDNAYSQIDAASDQVVLATLTDGVEIDLAGLTQFSIEAVAYPAATDRVRFSLTGPVSAQRTEGVAPFALFGDYPARGGGRDYLGEVALPGDYALTVQPLDSGRNLISEATIGFRLVVD